MNSAAQDNESSSYKATYTWEINNFSANYSYGSPVNSPDFSPPSNNQVKFNLKAVFKASTAYYNGPQDYDVLLTLCMKKQIIIAKFQRLTALQRMQRNAQAQAASATIDDDDIRPQLPVYYRISFLDTNGQKHHSQEGKALFNNSNANNSSSAAKEPIEGWEYRISYEYLRKQGRISNNGYGQDTVKILCEVLIVKDSYVTLESSFAKMWLNKKPQPEPEIEIPIPKSKSNETLDHYQTLLESGTLSDVVLVVGKKEFHAHKAILAARSSVFAAMFTNDLKEKLQNRVVIPDLDVEVCELLLPYIYTGKVPSMEEYALELFFASDKYQFDHLKSICEQNLIKTLSIQTVAHTLLLADMHSAAYLKRKCVEYITRNSEQVMATKGWLEMTKSRPELLMELYKDISAKANPLLK